MTLELDTLRSVLWQAFVQTFIIIIETWTTTAVTATAAEDDDGDDDEDDDECLVYELWPITEKDNDTFS